MTLHVEIAGTEYAQVRRESLTVSETLGSPPTASFVLDDLTGVLDPSWWSDHKLADIRIWDTVDTGDLFRGQVTNVRASIEGVARVLEVDATGYDRLLDYTLVGHEVRQYNDLSVLTADAWMDAVATGSTPDVPTVWADINANTGIALPEVDDASVVRAFFDEYWRGPTLTYDITEHCTVDSGTSIDLFDETQSDRRTFFGMTTLRDVLEQIGSLVGSSLGFWIDADLVFHWRTLVPVISSSATAPPSGSVLHSLPRLLPESRDFVASPYVVSETADVQGKLGIELPMQGVVDGVYVRGGTADASGLVDFGGTYGAQAYVNAPWVRLAGEQSTAAAYAAETYGTAGRTTITFVTTADWHDVHVGQSLTLYHPTLGIATPTAYVIRGVTTGFLPENVRTYSLALGDGVLRTASAYGMGRTKDPKKGPPESVPWPDKFAVDMGWDIALTITDSTPGPGSTQWILAQYTDQKGTPIAVDGLKVQWGVAIGLSTDPVDGDGNTVLTKYWGSDATSDSLMYSLAYATSVTFGGGKATNVLRTHANATAGDVAVPLARLA